MAQERGTTRMHFLLNDVVFNLSDGNFSLPPADTNSARLKINDVTHLGAELFSANPNLAHEDPARRYVASVAAGVFYLAIGLAGATVGALFAALPRELVMAIAGLALFGTIGGGLATALKDETDREPALITFLVTASGLTLFGIGSAFWGLVAGGVALGIARVGRSA